MRSVPIRVCALSHVQNEYLRSYPVPRAALQSRGLPSCVRQMSRLALCSGRYRPSPPGRLLLSLSTRRRGYLFNQIRLHHEPADCALQGSNLGLVPCNDRYLDFRPAKVAPVELRQPQLNLNRPGAIQSGWPRGCTSSARIVGQDTAASFLVQLNLHFWRIAPMWTFAQVLGGLGLVLNHKNFQNNPSSHLTDL